MKKIKWWMWPLGVILVLSAIVGIFTDSEEAADSQAAAEQQEETEDQETNNNEKEEEPVEEANEQENNEAEEAVELEIPEEAINMTIDTTMGETLVNDAHIDVKEDRIIISIIVNAAITEDKAKEVGENAARQLAAFSGHGSPTKDYLGAIYDQYNLTVGVGTSPDNIIVQGVKVPVSPHITW